MAVVKDLNQIKVQGGNNFQVNAASAFETLGHIESGRFRQQGSKVSGVLGNGFKWSKRSSAEASFEVVLSQVSSEIYKRIMQLVGKTVKFYFHNGQDDNLEDMELYSNSAEINEAIDITMKGDEVQTIVLDISLNPPEGGGIMTCVPDTDLPTDAFASGVSAVDSASPFIVMMNTIAA